MTLSPRLPPASFLRVAGFFTSAGDNSLPSFPLIPEMPTGSAAEDNDKNPNCRNNGIIGDELLHRLQTFRKRRLNDVSQLLDKILHDYFLSLTLCW